MIRFLAQVLLGIYLKKYRWPKCPKYTKDCPVCVRRHIRDTMFDDWTDDDDDEYRPKQ